MRISDWSSDVCSSDLTTASGHATTAGTQAANAATSATAAATAKTNAETAETNAETAETNAETAATLASERVQKDRKSVVAGKSVSVRVDLGGCRIIKKKNKNI